MATAHTTASTTPLTESELASIDAWWRAANYLTVGPDLPAGEPAAA